MYLANESMPDCVPELYRLQEEEQDNQYEMKLPRRAAHLANRKKLDAAADVGLPILYYGGYYACGKCPQADHDTQTDDEDDLGCVICGNPACPEHGTLLKLHMPDNIIELEAKAS